MIEWIKQLTPEFYIIIGFLFVLFVLIIVQMIRLAMISRRLGTQDFKILENIAKDDDGNEYYEIIISNQAFSTNNLNKIGFLFNKASIHTLVEVNKLIPPRNKHVELLTMEYIESITIIGAKKFKKVRVYAENDMGDKKVIRGKVINRYLKRKFKAYKKEEKARLKAIRFETGNYNFWERIGLILKLFGRPFYKLNQKIKRKTNNALKESEVRRLQKAEHDKVEAELTETVARTRNIEIQEETMKENKTREMQLELIKQQKVLEIEKLKRQKILDAYEERLKEIEGINVLEEVINYFEENPIDYEKIDEDIIKEIKEVFEKEEADKAKAKEKAKKEAAKKEAKEEKRAEKEIKKETKISEEVVKEEPVEPKANKEEIKEESKAEEKEPKKEEKKLPEAKKQPQKKTYNQKKGNQNKNKSKKKK